MALRFWWVLFHILNAFEKLITFRIKGVRISRGEKTITLSFETKYKRWVADEKDVLHYRG